MKPSYFAVTIMMTCCHVRHSEKRISCGPVALHVMPQERMNMWNRASPWRICPTCWLSSLFDKTSPSPLWHLPPAPFIEAVFFDEGL